MCPSRLTREEQLALVKAAISGFVAGLGRAVIT